MLHDVQLAQTTTRRMRAAAVQQIQSLHRLQLAALQPSAKNAEAAGD